MEIEHKIFKRTLYLYLNGDIDEHSSSDIRKKVDKIIDESTSATSAVFNLSGINFMDSTGIGFLIGRYKKLKRYGMGMRIEEPNAATDKILTLSGVYSLVQKN